MRPTEPLYVDKKWTPFFAWDVVAVLDNEWWKIIHDNVKLVRGSDLFANWALACLESGREILLNLKFAILKHRDNPFCQSRSSGNLIEWLCTAGDEFQESIDAYKEALPSNNNTMNTLRETIWNGFIKTKIKKLAKLVEAVESIDIVSILAAEVIDQIEIAIDNKNKAKVNKLYARLKLIHKVQTSDEALTYLNAKQWLDDLIEKVLYPNKS